MHRVANAVPSPHSKNYRRGQAAFRYDKTLSGMKFFDADTSAPGFA
jgi:hypothetical protein